MQERVATGALLLETAYYTLRCGEIEWLGAMGSGGEMLNPSLSCSLVS
jgi:hypothetical protein